jgi:hypothetical protein
LEPELLNLDHPVVAETRRITWVSPPTEHRSLSVFGTPGDRAADREVEWAAVGESTAIETSLGGMQ